MPRISARDVGMNVVWDFDFLRSRRFEEDTDLFKTSQCSLAVLLVVAMMDLGRGKSPWILDRRGQRDSIFELGEVLDHALDLLRSEKRLLNFPNELGPEAFLG